MNQITKRDLELPEDMRIMLDQQLTRMQGITELTAQALEEESEIYRYAVFKTLSTISLLDFWRKAAISSGAGPEIEAWFDQCIRDYLYHMGRIPEEAGEKIFRVLEAISPESLDDIELLENAVTDFRRRLIE